LQVVERVQPVGGDDVDRSAASAVAARRAAFGDIFLAAKGDTSVAAVAGFHADGRLIDEHPDYFTAKRLPGVLWSTGFSRSSRLKPVIRAEAGAPLLDRRDADEAAALALVGVLDDAVDLRVERVVAADTDILPGVEMSSALANQNRAAGNKLA